MKAALLVISALAALIAALIFGYRWDTARNRGHTWGYWGEFNAVSNALATVPGVTILSPWYNADVTLEEFGFDILVQGRQVKLAFGEKDPIRRLSGQNLHKALSQMVEKQSSNKIGGDEPPPRFSVRGRAGVRERLVRSRCPVGGGRSPLPLCLAPLQ